MSPEDEPHTRPLGFSCYSEDVPLSCADLDRSQESGIRSRAHSCCHMGTPEVHITCHRNYASGKSPFLKILMDAEAAANSAVIQLMSFKDTMEDEFADLRQSATDKCRVRRQRRLLLEKLEDFRRMNKSVRQKLKQLQEAETERVDANLQIDTLMKKIRQTESENEQLKRDLSETERRVEDLMDLRREEQENIKTAVHVTKSVEATRAHLQGQLRSKEAENNRLTVQLRNLERTLMQQKMEIDDVRGSITCLTEKATQDKESLKKATRAQKLRAERFEAAIEKCYAQMREKDAQLAKVCSERDFKEQQIEQIQDERIKLLSHNESLKSQITDLTTRMQKTKDEFFTSKEALMQQVEKLCAENGNLNINNATLQASVAQLQQQLAECESTVVEEKAVSEERKHQVQRCQNQAAELQVELEDLKIKYANVLREAKKTQEENQAVEKVRQELQGRVEELKRYPELLRAAEQSLLECQQNLHRLESQCSEKSESVRQLQVQMESQKKSLRCSAEMNESIHEANLQLKEKISSLQRQMEQLQQENLELVRRLAAQEEALSYSNRQLDHRSSECQALSRQLEAAISDVKQQVNRVKQQALSREEALQMKVLELEAEKSRRETELRLLRQSKVTAEKQFEVRLKDLQLSLEQSESHKQSIQNYVDFLKNSYKTMFDEGLQASSFGSSYFLK
ncbi:outer dense fiber protein 2-like isoform X1 [Betta splendens]|uniref:Outer dense fiber protein 2-like isoform X1 n=1 Tax=Betta splendens TaxID=158456 RepID=A0A6P7L0Y4_BETSP|nr:outer dense fiber protein 2-like isoform X1 [Betta splendens]XP_028986681.1 outer dense fiber protein 2-like isoform X1 [Betta splendens]XP_028986682.1 outer dense fiber protein 2-like isoform X1 [Betta splendens]XP_028986684.1 outer dense fiber protein 2-like isoform X1 [Betta splendens]XP_028986685.1 outer dense fiber protein 2-like isoform X1 [Betta splendens]